MESPANKEQPSAHAKSRKGKGEEEKARDVNESVQRGQIDRLYHSEHLMCKADALNCLKCSNEKRKRRVEIEPGPVDVCSTVEI